MNIIHYNPEIIECLFLDGLTCKEIATAFTGSGEAVYYHVQKLNIYLKKRCVECGKYFETRRQHKKRCNTCKHDRHSKYFEVRNVRSAFVKVVHRKPELAEFLKRWMQEEEGKKFTDMALDGILENEVKKQ